jgi:hypothetical protein
MLTQKVRTWDVLQSHPIAKGLEDDAKLALACEYVDLRDDLQGMSLAEFIDSYFAADAGDEAAEAVAEEAAEEPVEEEGEGEPSANGDDGEGRPQSMVGMRVVYRWLGMDILSEANGVTSDSDRTLRVACNDGVTRDIGTVAFTDVDGQPWSNVLRTDVYPIYPENYREIHVMPREAKEIEGWLAGGKPVKDKPEGKALRNLSVEFTDHPDKIMLVIMNGKRPYVDRFVQKPDGRFEGDQKPTTRLFGEHGFVVRGKAYLVNVVSP